MFYPESLLLQIFQLNRIDLSWVELNCYLASLLNFKVEQAQAKRTRSECKRASSAVRGIKTRVSFESGDTLQAK